MRPTYPHALPLLIAVGLAFLYVFAVVWGLMSMFDDPSDAALVEVQTQTQWTPSLSLAAAAALGVAISWFGVRMHRDPSPTRGGVLALASVLITALLLAVVLTLGGGLSAIGYSFLGILAVGSGLSLPVALPVGALLGWWCQTLKARNDPRETAPAP